MLLASTMQLMQMFCFDTLVVLFLYCRLNDHYQWLCWEAGRGVRSAVSYPR
jgi:hypothetical protein